MQKNVFIAFFLFVFCAVSFAETIKLPQPKLTGNMPLETSIYYRRSARSFYPAKIPIEMLSQILWACQGITDKHWNFRSAPSAGAIYPLEIYIADEKGVYHYIPATHSLELTTKGDKRPNLARASLTQNFISEAPVNLIITAILNRTKAKFGSRSGRYVLLEAGHAAENVLLQATALGLSSAPIGSFWDDVVASNLNLPPENDPLYILPIGYEKK